MAMMRVLDRTDLVTAAGEMSYQLRNEFGLAAVFSADDVDSRRHTTHGSILYFSTSR